MLKTAKTLILNVDTANRDFRKTGPTKAVIANIQDQGF